MKINTLKNKITQREVHTQYESFKLKNLWCIIESLSFNFIHYTKKLTVMQYSTVQ